MASFVNRRLLDVDLDIGSKRATITVSGRVSFTPLERQLMQSGLAMTIKGKLMGADSGFLGNDDFVIPSVSKPLRATNRSRSITGW